MTDQERIAKHGINVLSFFDGISAGQEALRQLGVKVANYYAIEIEESAMKVTNHNFPNTIQKGDILAWENKEREFLNSLPEIDLVFAGSPCQGFSKSGNREGLNHELSRLFFNFYRILSTINTKRKRNRKPPVPFFFENVEMDSKIKSDVPNSSLLNVRGINELSDKDKITKYLGVGEPILLDSVHYSPMARSRLYWTNFNIPRTMFSKYLDDRVYQDIMTPDSLLKRSMMIPANPKRVKNKKIFHKFSEPRGQKLKQIGYFWYGDTERIKSSGSSGQQADRVYAIDSKMPCMMAKGGGWGAKAGLFERSKSKVPKGVYTTTSKNRFAIKPDVNTCEIGMGFPKDYTSAESSDELRKQGLGNSWHVSVVKMIIESYCARMGWIGTRKS